MDGTVGSLNVKISADISGLEEGLGKARDISRQVGDAVAQSFERATEKAGSWGRVMAMSARDALPAVQSLTNAYSRLADTLAELGRALQKSIKPMDLSQLVPAEEVTTAVGRMWTAVLGIMRSGGKAAVAAFDGSFVAGLKGSLGNVLGDTIDKMAQMVSLVEYTNAHLPKIKIEVDRNIKLPHFSIRGSVDAQNGSVPRVSVSWYDKGGLFDKPQVIGIAERRPEFVGAVQDLKTFIYDAVDSAFHMAASPVAVSELKQPQSRTTRTMVVNINNKYQPREMTAAQMDYQAYSIRREIGRLTNL